MSARPRKRGSKAQPAAVTEPQVTAEATPAVQPAQEPEPMPALEAQPELEPGPQTAPVPDAALEPEPPKSPDELLAAALSPAHLKLIKGSAISSEVALARGYRTVTVKAELETMGFARNQRSVPALLVPIYNVAGELATYQLRPDEPRVSKGKAIKYETPAGSRLVIDVPRPVRAQLRDPAIDLYVTEGARKADAAVSKGLCCVALMGVWNFRGTNEHGGSTTLPDWDQIAFKGTNGPRTIYIAFDSDVTTKPAVQAALSRLKAFFEQKGAKVLVLQLPSGLDGSKVGLDDFLAAGNTVEALLASVSKVPIANAQAAATQDDAEYFVDESGTHWRKYDESGDETIVHLANFGALITEEVIRDDGADVQRQLELKCTLYSTSHRVIVPTASFAPMSWVIKELGPKAIVEPGMWVHDRLRAAIQKLSGKIGRRTVYAHTGWREIDGKWVYLHAGGAIGAAGAVPQVDVDLIGVLSAYRLPEPPQGARRVEAFQALLELLDLGSPELIWPIIGVIARTPVGDSKCALHLAGPTGVFKTELAALAQQCWGPTMDAAHLPGSWSSTGNATETLAFYAKDSLLVVDDFAPRGTQNDQQRFHQLADRVFRSQGNRSSRLRMRPDGSLQAQRPPRCVLLSTGEEIPVGQSVRARVLTLEVSNGDIKADVLTRCQLAAASGIYAEAMAAYVQWLAPRLVKLRAVLNQRVLELRATCSGDDQHRRTPSQIADLQAGVEVLLGCMQHLGALDEHTAERLRVECWESLKVVATAQADHVRSSEPTEVFMRSLRSALMSGAANMRALSGEAPPLEIASAVGWAKDSTSPSGDLVARSPTIGWIDGGNAYLEMGASLKAVQSMSSDGERIALTTTTLVKRMRERNLILSREVQKGRNTVRITVANARRTVVHISASHVLGPPQSPQPPQGGAGEAAKADVWGGQWGGGDDDGVGTVPATVPNLGVDSAPSTSQAHVAFGAGAIGAVGALSEQESVYGGAARVHGAEADATRAIGADPARRLPPDPNWPARSVPVEQLLGLPGARDEVVETGGARPEVARPDAVARVQAAASEAWANAQRQPDLIEGASRIDEEAGRG